MVTKTEDIEIIEEDAGTGQADKEAILDNFVKIAGVGRATAGKIYDGGYYNLIDIGAASLPEFVGRTGIKDEASKKIIASARTLADIGRIESTAELIEKENHQPCLTTGSVEFDKLIGGGYQIRLLTEIHSLNGMGKTQCCLTAAVMATQPIDKGGLDGYVVYVDTENTYRGNRVLEITKERGLNPDDVIPKIHHIDASSSSYQIVVMDQIREFAQTHPVRLLIIDSVMGHFRSEYPGRTYLAERQQKLNGYLADLLRFAKANDAVVLMTNQMAMRPDAMLFSDPAEAVGGNILGHASAVRILVRRGKGGRRIVKLEKCPFIANGEAVITVNAKGICDDKV